MLIIINKMEDKCDKPDELAFADIFKNTQDLMKAMGADEKCVKAANTWGQTNATSGNAYVRGSAQAGFGAASAEAEAGAAFQNSSTAFQNAMNESGCGTYVVNATKQSTNIKKIQCTIQKAQNQSEVGVSATNSIKIRTLPLSDEEKAQKERLISDITNKYAVNIPRPTIKDYADLVNVIGADNVRKMMLEDQKQWDASRQSLLLGIQRSYSRDLNMTNTDIAQKITGKIKLISSLSAEEIQNIESATKSLSKSVAEQEVSAKAGVNASSPNLKTVTDTNLQTNENVSGTAINAKIQNIKQQITASNDLTIEVAGNINMDKVRIDQSILLDIAAESIIASSIQAGIKAASEIVSDSSAMQKIKTESKGLDDLVKAQGEANAAAIQAGKVGPIGAPMTSSIFIVAIIFSIIFLPKPVTYGICIVFLIVFIIFFNVFMYTLRKYTNNETVEDKMQQMKRSVLYYNKIWTSFGCTKELTYDDIMSLELEKIDNNNLYDALEYIFKLSLVPNAKQIYIDLCFADKKVPLIFLPKIKMKNPKDLTETELKEIWNKYSNCPITNFNLFYEQWKKDLNDSTKPFKYVTFSDVAVEIDKCGLDYIKTKKPANLTDEDLKILWSIYGNCKTPFSNVNVQKYKNLTDITAVLTAMTSCKEDPTKN